MIDPIHPMDSTGNGEKDNVTLPKISVVVPTYNRGHWVGGAIRSLFKQRTRNAFQFEVIVVDNASKDNTQAEVESAFDEAQVPTHYIYSEKPGDAPTRNAGVRQANGDWIAFFDDDQFASEDWLYELLQAAQEADAGLVGGPVHLDLTDEQLEDLGPLGRKALREIDFYPTLQPYRGGHLPGTGNALVARRVFDEVGMFDESMTMGGSDFNFFLRARAAGYQLWYAPQAIIRHRIEPHRLTAAYHRWDAMTGSAQQAHFDAQRRGAGVMAASAIARLARMVLVTLPTLAWGWATRNTGQQFSRRIQLWRTIGYARGGLKVMLPRLCAQQKFFEKMDFRNGRTVGKVGTDAATEPQKCDADPLQSQTPQSPQSAQTPVESEVVGASAGTSSGPSSHWEV